MESFEVCFPLNIYKDIDVDKSMWMSYAKRDTKRAVELAKDKLIEKRGNHLPLDMRIDATYKTLDGKNVIYNIMVH